MSCPRHHVRGRCAGALKGGLASCIPRMPPVVSRVRRSSDAGQNRQGNQGRYNRLHDNHSLSHPDNTIADRNRFEWSIKHARQLLPVLQITGRVFWTERRLRVSVCRGQPGSSSQARGGTGGAESRCHRGPVHTMRDRSEAGHTGNSHSCRVGDPLRSGLVASLASPGGNVSGVSLMAVELHGKCVELLRDMLPTLRRVAGLFNGDDPSWKAIQEQVILAGKATGVEIHPSIMVHGASEIDTALAKMKSEGAAALVVQGSLATKQVADLALTHGLPATTVPRVFAEVGGLMTYGAAGPDTYRRSALFVTKILQGASPASMPVEQPAKFELVINLKTATRLSITVPQSFLSRADEVIE
jgi:ABC transporter substrate binding protein